MCDCRIIAGSSALSNRILASAGHRGPSPVVSGRLCPAAEVTRSQTTRPRVSAAARSSRRPRHRRDATGHHLAESHSLTVSVTGGADQ